MVVFEINWKKTLYRKNRILGIREKSPPRCQLPDLSAVVQRTGTKEEPFEGGVFDDGFVETHQDRRFASK